MDKKHSTLTFPSPRDALGALLEALQPVETETVNLADAAGRILAEPLVSDRDSPPCDVSQMDGYAVRLRDLEAAAIPVAGEAMIGKTPRELPPAQALRIFTGAPVPAGTEAVIPRENVEEHADHIVLKPDTAPPGQGQFIRRRGENLTADHEVLCAGIWIGSHTICALAAFGKARVKVFRRVRVGMITTGNELVPPEENPEPWQIRDSNGPAMFALFSKAPWLQARFPIHLLDDPETIRHGLAGMMEHGDAIFLTGGVSMGQYDHVPDVVHALGGRAIFHRLPIRPGKPVLGAVGPAGQLILGLPGNPVSALVTACRLGGPALRRRAGMRNPQPSPPVVRIANPDQQQLALSWFRPVRLVEPGVAELVENRGSGDIVALARSEGFIELPPRAAGPGPWPLYPWEI